jgi:hypothetical protein
MLDVLPRFSGLQAVGSIGAKDESCCSRVTPSCRPLPLASLRTVAVVRAAVRSAAGLSAIPGETDPDSPFDSQLVRIGLDAAGRRWSVSPVQSGFRGPWWTVLDPASLVATQEVRVRILYAHSMWPQSSAGG